MKKNTISILGVIAISFTMITTVQAQFLRVGPKVGLSSSRVQVEEKLIIDNRTVTYETGDAKLGFHVGAFGRVQITSWSIQPELLFTSAGGYINVSEEGVEETDVRKLVYNKIDVPVLLGKSFGKIIHIQAGPSFSFLLSDDARDISLREDLKQDYNKSTVGYQAGIGFDFGDLSIDFRYEGNLSRMGESISFGNETFKTDLRNNQFIVTLGLNLL